MLIKRPSPGFTLVELLCVLAMIGILLGLLLPAVQAMRESARSAQCQQRMSLLHLAIAEYHVSHDVWPVGTFNPSSPIESVPQGYHQNWLVQLLPHLDYRVIAERVDWTKGVYESPNDELRLTPISALRCPSAYQDPNSSASNYAGSHHFQESPIAEDNLGLFILNRAMNPDEDVPDGLRTTLLFGEKLGDVDDLGWASGTRATLRNVGHPFATAYDQESQQAPAATTYVGGFGSAHPAGVYLFVADGQGRIYHRSTDQRVLSQIADRQDGAATDPPR